MEQIILNNYKNNGDNIEKYYQYFKKYNINILSLRTDKRSGILKHHNKKIYFYIWPNDKIEIESV